MQLETERLMIRAIAQQDEENYQNLYQNPEVMLSYADGKPRSTAGIRRTVEINIERWAKGNPFSCMTIEHKASKDFMGSIFISTYGREDNTGILGYLLLLKYWRQRYATEAVMAMFNEYLSQVNKGQYPEQITSVVAYASSLNVASVRILEKAGFQKINEVEKFGAKRNEYRLWLN
jgi:RimJ/RimL family protein N-acetyltransferase